MRNIGLIGNGNAGWIAGVQYLQSLLYGNSLLPNGERSSFQLFLHQDIHRPQDFQAVQPYLDGVHFFDYFPGRSFPWVRKSYQMVQQIRQGQWPRYPTKSLTQLALQNRVDLVFPANEVVQRSVPFRQISWIPDFQHLHLPQYFTAYQLSKRRQDFGRIMQRSDRVIVSNQSSYDDAVRLYPMVADKFVILNFTMYLGENWQRPEVTAFTEKYELPDKYLLFPSQFWKHKNHLRLLEALHRVRQAGLTDLVLVCTGHPHDPRHPAYTAEVQAFLDRYQLRPAVRLLGLLPRTDQVQLMRGAAAIVQPSLFEGWSALLEDCRSLGKTVLASDIPMHCEQQTEQTFLFDPYSVRAIADCLLEHWPRLRPGPHLVAESAGAAGYHTRIQEFARRFNQICHSTLSSQHA
ncbi:glycosyltransferase family 4 protein [Larkinella sp. VNQ87]|uniref:glycosyltransferase family 4 protein n=1 Tax=Larkinella sp. VNQ87 TaxID=3400921 RepID=UPI003C089115